MLYVSYTLHARKHFHFIGQKDRGPEKWNGSLLFIGQTIRTVSLGSQMAAVLLLKNMSDHKAKHK